MNDIGQIARSLELLSIVELRRLRRETLDWRVKAAATRRLWEKEQQRSVIGSTKGMQLRLFEDGKDG